MRVIYGMEKLKTYLTEQECPADLREIAELIETRRFPHLRPFKNQLAFNLDHVDLWIRDQGEK
ncbi:hypothetical protein [Alteribacter natronophilus]|uniref:hypothetical protein n=1 Tax=Alteribacter natronophilus TaxID=2583810 RepID=UPI00110F308C|nr:hypothetical protein [Alteribacter natronophilus]TMW72877.1 hypothetical protein FGB90_00765 [Alteribacter natronophilus]